MVARLIAAPFGIRLGQSVVVDNRPGGGTTIGVKAAMTAEPDGLTLLILAYAKANPGKLKFRLMWARAHPSCPSVILPFAPLGLLRLLFPGLGNLEQRLPVLAFHRLGDAAAIRRVLPILFWAVHGRPQRHPFRHG